MGVIEMARQTRLLQPSFRVALHRFIAAAGALIATAALAVSFGAANARPAAQRTPIPIPQSHDCGTFDGTGCAPESQRVDLAPPVFSNPTNVTNPLFPVSSQASVRCMARSTAANSGPRSPYQRRQRRGARLAVRRVHRWPDRRGRA
jgi:hypothetical protein